MKTRNYIPGLLILFLLSSCAAKEVFTTSSAPIQPFFPERVGISFYSPPPVMYPISKTIDEIEISSQYFKIAVPLVLDRSGKAEAIKNLIDEQFVTALDKTKRFTVMDKGSMLNIAKQEYETGIYSEKKDSINANISAIDQTIKYSTTIPVANSAEMLTKPGNLPNSLNSITKIIDPKKNVAQFFGELETNPDKYERYIKIIQQYTDGILRITITGFDDQNNQMDIDYKINSSLSDVYILYTGKGKIGFTMDKDASTLLLNRVDIETIVDEIVKSFPNPDMTTLQIIQVNGKKITVNAGKNDNIKVGMLGYVVRQDGKRTAYRAMFEVTDVFPEAFSAELKVEEPEKLKDKNVSRQNYAQYPYLLNTIKVGEYVKMK